MYRTVKKPFILICVFWKIETENTLNYAEEFWVSEDTFKSTIALMTRAVSDIFN